MDRAPTPPVRINPGVPAELERIIGKTLEKDRDVRYHHASDITDLKRLKRETESAKTAVPGEAAVAPRRLTRLRALVAAAVILAALAVGYAGLRWYWARNPPIAVVAAKPSIAVLPLQNQTIPPTTISATG